FETPAHHLYLHSFPTRRSSDLCLSKSTHGEQARRREQEDFYDSARPDAVYPCKALDGEGPGHGFCSPMLLSDVCPGGACSISARSEEHTSELQSQSNLVCRLLL